MFGSLVEEKREPYIYVCVLIPDIALSPQPSATEVCARWRRLIKQSNFIYIVHFKNRGNSTCFTHTDEKDYKKTERLSASQHTFTQTSEIVNWCLLWLELPPPVKNTSSASWSKWPPTTRLIHLFWSAFLMTLDQDDEQWSGWPTGDANRVAGLEVSWIWTCNDVHMNMHVHMLKKFCLAIVPHIHFLMARNGFGDSLSLFLLEIHFLNMFWQQSSKKPLGKNKCHTC